MKIFLSLLLMSFFLSAAWSGTSFASDVSDGSQGGDMGNCCKETDIDCLCYGVKPWESEECCLSYYSGTIFTSGGGQGLGTICCNGAKVLGSYGVANPEERCCAEAGGSLKNGICCAKWTTVVVGNCPIKK